MSGTAGVVAQEVYNVDHKTVRILKRMFLTLFCYPTIVLLVPYLRSSNS